MPPGRRDRACRFRRRSTPARWSFRGTDQHAFWVFADLLTGPLWYYAGKPAYKITFTDAKTRALAYRFVFDRGEPQYVVNDCDAMRAVIAEIERHGRCSRTKGDRGQ